MDDNLCETPCFFEYLCDITFPNNLSSYGLEKTAVPYCCKILNMIT